MRPEIMNIITECSKTGKFNLDNMTILDDEISDIVNAINKSLPNVFVINLDSNSLSDNGARILGEALADFHALKQLSVQFNNIGPEGARAIFSLKNNLDGLDILFRGNEIVNVGEMAEIENAERQISHKF